jgi:cellulose synthase operon protein C
MVTVCRALLSMLFLCVQLVPSAWAVPPVDATKLEKEFVQTIKDARKVDALDSLALLWAGSSLLPVNTQVEHLEALTKKGVHPWIQTRAHARLFPFAASSEEARSSAKRQGFVHGVAVSSPQPCAPGKIDATHHEFMAKMGDIQTSLPMKPLINHGSPGFSGLEQLVPAIRQHALHVIITVVAREKKAAGLFLGSSGDMAVSVNGSFAGSVSALRSSRPDQLFLPVELRSGTNVIGLTLIPSATEELNLYVRLAKRGGERAKDLSHRPWKTGDGWPNGTPTTERLKPLVTLMKAPTNALGRLKRAVLKRSLGLADAVGADTRSLEDILLTDQVAALPIHWLLLAVEFVPAMEAKKSLLLHYWSSGRRDARVAMALANLCAEQENAVASRKWLDRVGPTLQNEQHRLVASRVWRYTNESERSWVLLTSPRDTLPCRGSSCRTRSDSEALRKERAYAARRLGRFDLSLPIWQALAQEKSGSIEWVGAVVEDLQALGLGEEALDTLDTLRKRHPQHVSLGFAAVRLAGVLKQKKRVRSLLKDLRRHVGADAMSMKNLALSYESIDEPKEALQVYRRLLRSTPNDQTSIRAVERLTQGEPEALPFPAFDLEEARNLPSSTEQDYDVLSSAAHVVVHASGSYTMHRRQFLRVQRVRAERKARTFSEQYDPSQTHVSIIQARVHRGDMAMECLNRNQSQISKSWYGMYYDRRQISVAFDDLKKGDIIELVLRTDTVGRRPIPNSYELFERLQRRYFTHHLSIELNIPSDLPLRTRLHLGEHSKELSSHFSESREERGDRSFIRFRGRNIPRLVLEKGMPGIVEVSPSWQATTFTSFQSLSKEYSKLILSQKKLTTSMQQWLEAKRSKHLKGDGTLNRGKFIRDVVEGIAQEVRYVGLEFGIHGFQPYRTDQVWVRRFGDCKDQATLLTTLLESVGIPAHVALIRTRPQGRVEKALPALGFFNHAIVWLPDSNRFVDTTVRTVGFDQLPSSDVGAQVLILTPDLSASLGKTSLPSPLSNGITSDFSVVLRSDGSGVVSGQMRFRGTNASAYRQRFSNRSTQVHLIGQMLNKRYPGSLLKNHRLSDLSDLQRPLELMFSAEVPGMAQKTDGGLRISLPINGHQFAPTFAARTLRTHPMRLGVPKRFKFRYHYVLPPGWTAKDLPANTAETSSVGSYRVHWQREAGAVRGELLFQLEKDQVNTDSYPAFYAFMQRLDKAIRPDLVLEQPKEGSR